MSRRGQAIVFVGSRLLLRVSVEGLRLPLIHEVKEIIASDLLERTLLPASVRDGNGTLIQAFGLDEPGPSLPEGYRLDGLRVAYHTLSERDFRAAGTARQKLEWHRTHRFCSRCGVPTTRHAQQEAMACDACGLLHFPRVAPAVIVLVEREGEALLGRSPHFQKGVYSTLAGFVEPGESLEECVHREIYEEVGVRVTDLRYFGSQPHPFPHSLMIGFVARWSAGEIRIDPTEIEDAGWFRPDALPELPHPMSIARALIEDFVRRCSGS